MQPKSLTHHAWSCALALVLTATGGARKRISRGVGHAGLCKIVPVAWTTSRQTLIGLAVALGPIASAQAQEQIATERTLTEQTGWWQYHNITPQELASRVEQNAARIIDLDVNQASPLRLSAALVANSGAHASDWWWYYGLSASELADKLRAHGARLIDLDVYHVNGQIRFAAVMVANTGAKAVAWWWYYGQTPEQLGARVNQHQARILDLERYLVGNSTRYAAILVSNQGSKATGWWWYYGQTADQVEQRITQHDARILDLERYRTGDGVRHDIVLVPNGGSAGIDWWWYYGVSAQKLLELARRHGARLVDIEPPSNSASGYSGLMIDNGMIRNGDCGGPMASFDRQITTWMKRYAIPGAAAAVVKGDRLVYACGFGYADLATGRPVSPTTLFRIASIAKPVTMSALRRLEEDGRIAFSDQMLARLGTAKPATPYADRRLHDITIQHLMEHRGGWDIGQLGLDPMFYSDQVAAALGTPRPASCRDVIRYMFQNKELDFAPGA